MISLLLWGRSILSNPSLEASVEARTCWAGSVTAPPPPPPHTHNFLEFVGILTKYVCKISWHNVVGKFGVLCHKKRNAELYQCPVPQRSNFYRQWRLLKKLYRICTKDYGNNEYLAVKYIRFYTKYIIWCL